MTARAQTLRLAFVTVGWLSLVMALVPWLSTHPPPWLQRAMSMQTFRLTTQVMTTVIGVGACIAFVPGARVILGLRRAKPASLALSVSLAPLVWILATIVALQVAMPTLLDELATRGAGASRQNAGAFGRELVQSSVLGVMLSGVLMAAVSEELLFRGALWGLIARLVPARERRGQLVAGVIATVLSAAAFGYAHHDLPGGVGIVRVVSTTCLGLAAGSVRLASGSIFAAMLLHALYNTASIALARGWFGGHKVTLFETPIPWSLAAAAPLCMAAVLALVWRARRRRFSAELT